MIRRFQGCWRRISFLTSVFACALTAASPAYSAVINYSSTVSTAPNTYLGGAGAYLPYTPINSSVAVTTSIESIKLGSFFTAPASAAPNANVSTSTTLFTLTIDTDIPGASTVTFAGSIVADKTPGLYDFNFSTGQTFTWGGDPNGPATFDVQNVGTCNMGPTNCYTVGVEPIQINGSGKTTALWAFIGPTNLTTPEPSTAALLALPIAVLLLLARRRKLQLQRS